MYCKYCGEVIDDDSIFCKFCGRKVASIEQQTYNAKKIDNIDEDFEPIGWNTYDDYEYIDWESYDPR